MIKAKIINCKTCNILKDPTCTLHSEEIMEELKLGDTVKIDTSKTYWSWNDKQYYKCESPTGRVGFINVKLVEVT